jgi:hypothetical protein
MENQTGTVAVKKGTKTEAELIATVANIHDADRCFLFAQRAREAVLLELVAACEERAKTLKPYKISAANKASERQYQQCGMAQ